MISNINKNYGLVLEGKMSKAAFVAQLRKEIPHYITQFTSYDDAVTILKNKKLLSEEIEYQCIGDKFPLEQIEKGLQYELKEMGLSPMCIPTPQEYMQAKKRAIDNLVKDSQYYVKKIEEGKMFLQEGKPVAADEKARRAGQKEADVADAQRLFNALMKMRASKKHANRWMAEDATAVLKQVRAKFNMPRFVPKGLPPSLSFSVKDDKFSDVWNRAGAVTKPKPGMREEAAKEGKLLKEAIEQIVTKVLNEAATTNLASLSDENATIQGIPAILNNLENIVTEIESFIIKEQEKIQGVFDTIGNIKNEDNIPIGYKFVQPIMAALVKDLQPVLDKISLDNIKVPEAPVSGEEALEAPETDEPVGPGIDPENLEVSAEEKATLFSPTGKKPNPLA